MTDLPPVREARRPEPDAVLSDMADYVLADARFPDEARETARLCLMDSLGCALAALDFPACTRLLGPVVPGATLAGGARVPGTPYELDPVQAAFDIGAMIRWLDFNDTFLAAEWGHPSDNLGAILAVADYLDPRPSEIAQVQGVQPFQVAHVAPGLQGPGAVPVPEQVDAGVLEGKAPGGVQGDGEGVAEQRAQDAAVGDHHDDLPGVPPGQLLQAEDVPRGLVPEALPPGHGVVGAVVAVLVVLPGVAFPDLVAAETLENAQVPFAQAPVRDDSVSGPRRDDPGGLERAAQVAAVDGGAAFRAEPSRQGFRLPSSLGGEGAVQVALAPTLDVPLGLPVPHDDEVGGLHPVHPSQRTPKIPYGTLGQSGAARRASKPTKRKYGVPDGI